MSHSRTAKKAVRQNERRRQRNKAAGSAMRTQIKKLDLAVAEGDAATARAELPIVQKLVDKAAKANRMHANKAARMKSRLARSVAKLG